MKHNLTIDLSRVIEEKILDKKKDRIFSNFIPQHDNLMHCGLAAQRSCLPYGRSSGSLRESESFSTAGTTTTSSPMALGGQPLTRRLRAFLRRSLTHTLAPPFHHHLHLRVSFFFFDSFPVLLCACILYRTVSDCGAAAPARWPILS